MYVKHVEASHLLEAVLEADSLGALRRLLNAVGPQRNTIFDGARFCSVSCLQVRRDFILEKHHR